MILLDANLLVYAANRAAPEHGIGRAWLDAQLARGQKVGLPWPSMLAFVRLVTNPLVVRSPASPRAAWKQIEDWLGTETTWIPVPTDRHSQIVARFFDAPWMTSRLVPDAHLAALAIEHGLTLCSTDGDFARFPGLTWQNPLAAV